jgi:hypothetical protein
MRSIMILGAAVVLASIAALVVQVVPFHHREEVAKVGPFTATEDKTTDVIIPPYVAIAGLLVGGGLMLGARRG